MAPAVWSTYFIHYKVMVSLANPPSVKNNLRKRLSKFSQQHSLHILQSSGLKLSHIVYDVTLEVSIGLPAFLVHKQDPPHLLGGPVQPGFGHAGGAGAAQTELQQPHLLLLLGLRFAILLC